MNTTATRVREYIIQNFLFDDERSMPPDDASLLKHGIIDSTGALDLSLFVDDTFGIRIADEDVTPENFDSVGGPGSPYRFAAAGRCVERY